MKRSSIFLKAFLLISLGIQASCISKPKEVANKHIRIEFNDNIEFLGFIWQMAWIGPDAIGNNSDIPTTHQFAYGLKVYHDYRDFADSPHLAKIKNVGTNIDYDPAIRLMLEVDNFPNATLPAGMSDEELATFSLNKSAMEGREVIITLLDEMNAYYKEVHFENYRERYKRYYSEALKQLNKVKPSDKLIAKMEEYYQQQFAGYTLVPSLLVPSGMGFGIRFDTEKEVNIFNVFGALDTQTITDEQLDMGFNNLDRMLELSIHEFGHSFANPVIDELPESLMGKTSSLFDPIKESMANQGYYTWDVCVKEHFVRAGEIILIAELGNQQKAEDLKNHYVNDRSFIYLPQILTALQSYQENPNGSFSGTVLRVMERLAENR